MPPSRQSSLKGGVVGGGSPSLGSSTSSGQGGAGAQPVGASGPTRTATLPTPTSSSSMDAALNGPNAATLPSSGVGASGGRMTPSFANSYVNRPGSASAVNRRRSEQTTASPIDPHFPHHLHHNVHHAPGQQQQQTNHHHPHYGQHHPYANVFEEDGPRSASAAAFDDESGKGHGGGRRASATFMSSSGRWTPTILTNMLRRAGEGRFSPVNSFGSHSSTAAAATTATAQHASPHSPSHKFFSPSSPRMKVLSAEPDELQPEEVGLERKPSSGRQRASFVDHGTRLDLVTEQPIKEDRYSVSAGGYYAPKPASGVQASSQARAQPPVSHSHKMSSSSTGTSSLSIQMHSPQMHSHSRHTSMQYMRHPSSSPKLAPNGNSSPLVVPQARRGAVNLRKTTRRRKASAAKRQRAALDSAPFHVKVARMVHLLFWSLCHPLSACQAVQCYLSATLHNVDLAFRDPRTGARVWRPTWLGAYIPLLIWLGVSLSSTFTVLIWHTQVFQALDRLSAYLQSLGLLGRLIFGSLIFITTFPPLPLYSTLIILCGFSFGLVQAFIISYIAALSGAIVVFLLSRSLLKGWMVGLLNQSGGLRKVVRAIEKRPKLLFLVRLAPYPYNLMNTLLASSPTLTLKTYTLCTALALPKLLVHCSLGTTIKNFAAYNGAAIAPATPLGDKTNSSASTVSNAPTMIGQDSHVSDQAQASETAELVKHIAGFVGVGLCVGIFLYLFSVARKAVDEELDDDELAADEYELMLSDEEDGAESVDGLDDDSLHISGGVLSGSRDGSSESTRFGEENSGSNSGSQRSSSHEATSSPMNAIRPVKIRGPGATAAAYGSGRYQGGSDATLVDTRTLSAVKQKKSAPIGNGSTPLYIAQSSGMGGVHGDGSGALASGGGTASYFGAWTAGSGNENGHQTRAKGGHDYVRAYMDSRSSLADSIVEMEKHADLFHTEDAQDALYGGGSAHDVSIELSPPPIGRRAKLPSVASPEMTNSSSRTDAKEMRQLIEVDCNRASRRSQMGFEEETMAGVNGGRR